MLDAPIPPDDNRRLAALRSLNILDTPPEQRFNRITRTAARIFQLPIALISLVDEKRQWFKSRYGLYAPETPRSVSFCGHAILNEGIFLVEDALKDERFHDNPLVTGPPHVRFYAGRPLKTPAHARLGTLCVIGHEAREFSEHERLALEDLAGWAEREINLSIAHAEVEARLTGVLDNVAEGAVLLAPDGLIHWTNEGLATLLGFTAKDLHQQKIDRLFSADALDAVSRALAQLNADAADGTTRLDVQCATRDGRSLLVHVTLVASTVDAERSVTVVFSRL